MSDTKADTAKTGEVKTYALCPMSGIGKPPEEWSHCVAHCSIYDATTGYCSLKALWHLQELPHIHDRVDGVGNVLACFL